MGGGFLVLIVLGFLLVWVFVLLPQRRRMAAHARTVAALKVGDEVLTVGGLYGDVTEIGDDELALEVAPGVEVRVATRAVATVTPPGTYVDEAEDGAPGETTEVEPTKRTEAERSPPADAAPEAADPAASSGESRR